MPHHDAGRWKTMPPPLQHRSAGHPRMPVVVALDAEQVRLCVAASDAHKRTRREHVKMTEHGDRDERGPLFHLLRQPFFLRVRTPRTLRTGRQLHSSSNRLRAPRRGHAVPACVHVCPDRRTGSLRSTSEDLQHTLRSIRTFIYSSRNQRKPACAPRVLVSS